MRGLVTPAVLVGFGQSFTSRLATFLRHPTIGHRGAQCLS